MKQLPSLPDLIVEFCEGLGGAVADIQTSFRANHQHLRPPGDGTLTCITAEVEFKNLHLLGSSQPFLSEVFPRLRYLVSKGCDFFRSRGVPANSSESEFLFGIVPLCDPAAVASEPLPKLERPSRGVHMPPIAELTAHSDYYRALVAQYAVDYGLMTNNGTVIGPDAGILASVAAASRAFRRPLRVTELGAGACATAISLSHVGLLAAYRGNDFSPEVGAFFDRVVLARLNESGVPAELVVDTCARFPLCEMDSDVLIVGVFYEAQPDLIVERGRDIARAIGNSGLLLIQSGKPENAFITELMTQRQTRLSRWPWYMPAFCLRRLFHRVEVTTVHDEVMVLASNDSTLIDKVLIELTTPPLGAGLNRSR